ncbi:MAG: TRIC cation channel family protein, partial [Lachnospiraceae bacterium]|nr:TRIC cation channel family protein [Lachnospiraceae bacterium]
MVETVIFIFEIIGTIAFSISGAIVAIEKKMDVLGVMILGLTTGVGGGVIRDVVIGNTPAQAFISPIYSLISIVVALIIFLPPVREWVMKENKFFQSFLLITDSIGLG